MGDTATAGVRGPFKAQAQAEQCPASSRHCLLGRPCSSTGKKSARSHRRGTGFLGANHRLVPSTTVSFVRLNDRNRHQTWTQRTSRWQSNVHYYMYFITKTLTYLHEVHYTYPASRHSRGCFASGKSKNEPHCVTRVVKERDAMRKSTNRLSDSNSNIQFDVQVSRFDSKRGHFRQ